MTEKIKRILNKEYKISIASFLQIALSLVVVGVIIGMTNTGLGWIALSVWAIYIVIKALPYIERIVGKS